MFDRKTRDLMVPFLVDAIDEARREYLQTTGSSVLKQFDVLQTRVRAAARQSATAPEWCTRLLHRLQVSCPGSSASLAIRTLVEQVDALGPGAHADLMALVEQELGYLMALARKRCDERKEAAEKKRLEEEAAKAKMRAESA